jgi:hypothetical protein
MFRAGNTVSFQGFVADIPEILWQMYPCDPNFESLEYSCNVAMPAIWNISL